MVKKSNESAEFEVESLVDKRITAGIAFYLVKWKDYSLAEASWEPISHLEGSMELVRLFEEKRGRKLKVAKKCVRPVKKDPEDCEERHKFKAAGVGGVGGVGGGSKNKSPSSSPVPVFNIENWHVSTELYPVKKPAAAQQVVPGCFRKHSVLRVVRILKEKGGKMEFEVEWKPKGEARVGNSVVGLEEFTENEPKTLIEYLASLM